MALTKVTNIVHEITNIGIEAGSVCYFYQDTAPTGWTIVDTVTDKVIGVKGGSLGSTGGTTAGTWTVANHTHTGPSHTHTGPSHTHTTGSVTLTTTQIPAHSHSGSTAAGGSHTHSFTGATPKYGNGGGEGSYGTILGGGTYGSSSNVAIDTATSHTHTVTINSAGGGGSHNHGATGAGGTGATGAGGTGATGGAGGTTTYRPATAVGILAEKDGVVAPTTWYSTFDGGTAWNYWGVLANCTIGPSVITEVGPGMAIVVNSESTWAEGFRPGKIRITGVPEGSGNSIRLYDGLSGNTIAGPELPATQVEMNISWRGSDMVRLDLYGMLTVTEIEFDVDPGGPYGAPS